MATLNPIAVKYTDVTYVTKQGFYAALGTSLVEQLWDKVLSYRAANATRTCLRTIAQLPFCVTSTDAIKAKIDQFKAKLAEFQKAYAQFDALPEEKRKLDRAYWISCLRSAAELEGIKVSDPTLSAMLSGLYRDGASEQVPILGYRDFLRQDAGVAFADCESFFADVYSAMSGTEELVSFYRVNDATVGYGRAGEYAKYNDIESLEQNLEDFVNRDPLDPTIKALLAMYFVEYIEPFAAHNKLMAVAIGKKMLSRLGYGSSAFLLPLEATLLRDNKGKDLCLETAKTGDFTYVLLHMIETLYPLLDAMLNELSRVHTDALRREFRSEMHEESVPEPANKLTEVEVAPPMEKPLEVAPSPKSEPVEVPMPPRQELEPEPVEEVEILVEEDEEEEEPLPTPKETPHRHPAPMEDVPVIEAIPAFDKSVFAPKVSLTDKEVKMAARYIVETHPDISKQQALFFASHSTLGRYYTIQDYKKAMRVAYETARTSMDRLAQAKLYKKLRIKNKYVYTPRSPGEKE